MHTLGSSFHFLFCLPLKLQMGFKFIIPVIVRGHCYALAPPPFSILSVSLSSVVRTLLCLSLNGNRRCLSPYALILWACFALENAPIRPMDGSLAAALIMKSSSYVMYRVDGAAGF